MNRIAGFSLLQSFYRACKGDNSSAKNKIHDLIILSLRQHLIITAGMPHRVNLEPDGTHQSVIHRFSIGSRYRGMTQIKLIEEILGRKSNDKHLKSIIMNMLDSLVSEGGLVQIDDTPKNPRYFLSENETNRLFPPQQLALKAA